MSGNSATVTTKNNKTPTSPLITQYLLAYNFLSCFSWLYVLFLLVRSYLNNTKAIYEVLSLPLYFAQSLAILEIVHSITRLVRAGLLTTFLQVISRLFLLWGVLYLVPDVQANTSSLVMIFAWGLVEVPRYLFYALNLLGEVPYPLLWLRYSLFIVLYPMGITGELLTAYAALPIFKGTNMLSVSMPKRTC